MFNPESSVLTGYELRSVYLKHLKCFSIQKEFLYIMVYRLELSEDYLSTFKFFKTNATDVCYIVLAGHHGK